MNIYNANYWEDYDSYMAKKTARAKPVKRRKVSKKQRQRKIQSHNSSVKETAKRFGSEMKENPSVLESKMQDFLCNQGIIYEFQKPLYIKVKNGLIHKFYIADFYIPSKNIIIETDGKFHDEQQEKDKKRTETIQKNFPNMKIIRWRWHDFESYQKMKELVSMLKS